MTRFLAVLTLDLLFAAAVVTILSILLTGVAILSH